jgi:hypothetical protein
MTDCYGLNPLESAQAVKYYHEVGFYLHVKLNWHNPIKRESVIYASISYSNYMILYANVIIKLYLKRKFHLTDESVCPGIW